MQARIARRLAAAAVLLAGLAALPAGAEPPSTVILISLDGTRPADIDRPELATFAELRRRGARASRLITVFPSNTFPSHVTLVTGVHPDVHGVVNNDFVDPERGEFHKSDDPAGCWRSRSGRCSRSRAWPPRRSTGSARKAPGAAAAVPATGKNLTRRSAPGSRSIRCSPGWRGRSRARA